MLRYLWLSSSDLIHGTSSESPLHFSFRSADLPRYARIVIVEGALKADVLFAIRPELYIVATPCVTANRTGLVELSLGRPVWIGFDQDHIFKRGGLSSGRAHRQEAGETQMDYICLGVPAVYNLERAHLGSHSAAAHRLGMHHNTFYDWLE